jgi:hypothetical protein
MIGRTGRPKARASNLETASQSSEGAGRPGGCGVGYHGTLANLVPVQAIGETPGIFNPDANLVPLALLNHAAQKILFGNSEWNPAANLGTGLRNRGLARRDVHRFRQLGIKRLFWLA